MHGWEPAEITTYIYDGDKLIRSVTVREPEWDIGALEQARAWLSEDLAVRGSHGHLLSEAMSKDSDPSNPKATRRYRAGLPSRDFAAQALNDAQDEYRKKYPDADMDSLRWRVEVEEL